METKPPTASYHHQRAPRTPESYFNVPESIALLNIVKSEKIQSAFQSNRKNHASVWEMVAEVLNRFSARKRSAKQCCNRYENLKKIYTQLKKNPERHVRRNWPYMFLFKEIEEQRGECWGSNGKRLALLTKNHHLHHNTELSYYQRRRQAVELSTLLNGNKDVAATMAQHGLLQSLGHSTDSNSNACKMERFLPNHFVETQLTEGNGDIAFDDHSHSQTSIRASNAAMCLDTAAAMHLQPVNSNQPSTSINPIDMGGGGGGGLTVRKELQNGCINNNNNNNNSSSSSNSINNNNTGNSMNVVGAAAAATSLLEAAAAVAAATIANGLDCRAVRESFGKDCNGALNLQTTDNNISLKSEPLSEGEFNPDDIQLMQTNYNGSQNYYPHDINPNLLHPDVIVDTDNMSSVSSAVSLKSKRKLSSSTDGDSTNYELIEYLKRREKRDEELFKRMDAREERLLNLLERTVVAIETLATSNPSSQKASNVENSIITNSNNTSTNNNNNNNTNNNSNMNNEEDNTNERTTLENTQT